MLWSQVAPEQTSDISLLLEEDLLRMGIRTDEDTGPRGTGSGSLLQVIPSQVQDSLVVCRV